MKLQNNNVFLVIMLFLVSLTACGATGEPPSVPETVVQAVEEEPMDYSLITDLFKDICPDAEVSGKKSRELFQVNIKTDFSTDSRPEDWVGITEKLAEALSLSKDLYGEYDLSTVVAQIITPKGDILASGFDGGIKYNLFEKGKEADNSNKENDGEEIKKNEITYVLNTNTMKFHYQDCKSADEIKSANRSSYVGDRSELISRGYSPCGKCNP